MSMTADDLDTGFAELPDGPAAGQEPVEVTPMALPDLGPGGARQPERSLRLLSGVHVELSVELGRSRLSMQDLLTLAPGAVVELDRPADAAVDILVNGTVVARGEVVVVNGEFGVRISEITDS